MFMWTENIKEGARYDIPPYTYKFEIDTDEKELLEDYAALDCWLRGSATSSPKSTGK